MKQPFFYDITLRDGNQALKKPWRQEEKEIVFEKLTELKVQGVEIGFPASSQMDFDSCVKLAEIAPSNMIVSVLSRCVQSDITAAVNSVKKAKIPRVHTFLTLSPFHMKYVLAKQPDEVRKIVIDAVSFAYRELIKENKNGQIQFSCEHFGDCAENLDFVIDTFKQCQDMGVTVINLPNTVERYRPGVFVRMVERVRNALDESVTIAVHNHNDLGMATATTVESYFHGAVQLECALNGLGERAGNTNLYEVAVALHNCGVDVPIDLSKIYETALTVSQMAKIPIFEKAPLIGPDALAHRSGIHQDGALKTKDMEMGAYRPIHPSLIGRNDDEKIGITSQSGKTAIFETISKAGYPITLQEAVRIAPIVKESAEKIGELSTGQIIDIYFSETFNVKGHFQLENFKHIKGGTFEFEFLYKNKDFIAKATGNGPIDACIKALRDSGFNIKLLHYEQSALGEEVFGAGSTAMTVVHIEDETGREIIGRARHGSTAVANIRAIFNALNIIYK
ncbi:MAG: hypothetical protein LUE64_04785 [Candidatus Gastranaerophilales bacterium]|nr:hypothetical protein [Candidatus Gastranaerophilales bacterium]